MNRSLVCCFNPTKTVIVKNGDATNLVFDLDGEKITDDVSSMQVAIWNNSKLSIKTDNILEPLQIISNNKKPILEAKILKFSRDVCEIKIIDKDFSSGVVTIGWNILEKDDGAIIQITYLGDVNNDFSVNVTIEGQKKLIAYSSKKRPDDISVFKTTKPWYYKSNDVLKEGFFHFVLSVFLFYYFFQEIRKNFSKEKPRKFSDWIHYFLMFILFVLFFGSQFFMGILKMRYWHLSRLPSILLK